MRLVLAQGSRIWGIVGPTDLPEFNLNSTANGTAAEAYMASQDDFRDKCPPADPNVVMWGSYPVNNDHLMGEPSLVSASIGFRLEANNVWPGLTNRKIAYTGEPTMLQRVVDCSCYMAPVGKVIISFCGTVGQFTMRIGLHC